MEVNLNYKDYVCGTRFSDLAEAKILDNGAVKINTLKLSNAVYPVLYCHTHQFNHSIDKIKSFNKEIVLITHNSDGCVRDSKTQELREYDADVNLLPSNVIRWYAQNVDLQEIPEKVVPIPIGLENRYCFDYDKAAMLFEKETQVEERKKKLYVNFNLDTNLVERNHAYHMCRTVANGCTIRLARNGEDYERFLHDLHTHIGVVCPRGNGLDCHRTYEGLYLRTIPVMKYIPSIASFGLPIIFVNEWKDLAAQIDDIIDKLAVINEGQLNMNTLSMQYWRNRIVNAT
jgi:hypothetical protein